MSMVIVMGKDFFETIFLKEGSIQDSVLSSMLKNKNASSDDIHMLQMGIAGEKQIMYHLKKSNIGMYALRDIFLKHDGYTAQIDFVLITSHHCYFVESKNYNADIIRVDETGQFVLSTRYGKKYNRKGIKSPISQVEEQLDVFQKESLDYQDEMQELLKGNKFKDYFKTMVVFTNQDIILDLKKAPSNLKYRVLKIDNLVSQIEYDNNHFKGKRLSQEEMNAIAEFILKRNVVRDDYIIDRPIPIQNNGYSNKEAEKSSIGTLEIIGLVVLVIAILILVLFIMMIAIKSISRPRTNTHQQDNSQNTITNNGKELTADQNKAIKLLKKGYENSNKDGFSIVHTSVCNEISAMFDNKLGCGSQPLIVNVSDDESSISIYHNFACYRLELSGNVLIDSNQKYVGYDSNKECDGIAVGMMEWDDSNELYKKIGGYDKINAMAIDIYNNGRTINEYVDYSHIEERGGNPNLASTYWWDVTNFFKGVTGKGPNAESDTNKKEFNEMIQNYYYIMKE